MEDNNNNNGKKGGDSTDITELFDGSKEGLTPNANQNDQNNDTNNTNTDTEVKVDDKVYKLDKDGNALGEDGKVFKTKVELEALKTNQGGNQNNDTNLEGAEAVELDGVKYSLDKEGNALDKDGKVFKTKKELEEIIANQLPPLVDEIVQKLGYEIKGADGKPKVYEDSVDGIIEYAKDVAALQAQKEREKLFEAYPDVKELLEHRQRGGKTEDFIQRQSESWKGVKLDKANEQQLIDVVVDDLISAGMDKEQAQFTAKTYKDTGKLFEFGEQAQKRLVKAEDDYVKGEKEAYEQEQKQFQEYVTKHWSEVNQIIKQGKLGNITIPEADRDAFSVYVSKSVDDNGNSQEMLDAKKASKEARLQLSYYQFKGYDLGKLVANAVKTERTLNLRTRVTGHGSGLGDGQGIKKDGYVKPQNVDININNLKVE